MSKFLCYLSSAISHTCSLCIKQSPSADELFGLVVYCYHNGLTHVEVSDIVSVYE